MANPDRSGVRTFRSGAMYVAVTAGAEPKTYCVSLYTRFTLDAGAVRFVRRHCVPAESAPQAAKILFDDVVMRGLMTDTLWYETGPDESLSFSKVRFVEITDYSRAVALDGPVGGNMSTKRPNAYVLFKRAIGPELRRVLDRLRAENIPFRLKHGVGRGEGTNEVWVRRPLLHAARAAVSNRRHFSGCTPC